jgi:DNA polymerase-3 subunit delta
MAVYFYYGDEDFLIDSEIERMRAKLNPDFISMSFNILDNPEYSELINILRTPPMMFGDSLYIINAEKYFSSTKNYFEDSELEDIEDALQNNPPSLNIVFVVKLPRDEGKKLDTRRKLYKILSKFNSEEFQAFKTYKTDEIANWIRKQAKKKDIIVKDDAVNLLIELLGNNLRQFDIELDKLKLIAYPEKTVNKKMVEDIAISNQDLFNITDLIMKNKKDEALLEFKKLTDKKHPLEILAAIQTMLRKWIIIKTKASENSTFEISKIVGMHEFVIKQNIQKLKGVSVADLVRLKQNLYETECRIKSGESLDINSEVEIALIR